MSDLGFVGSKSYRANHRGMMQHSYALHKGMYMRHEALAAAAPPPAPPSAPNPASTPAAPPRVHGAGDGSLLSHRCEYLERQEKYTTATLSEQISKTQQLDRRLDDACTALHSQLTWVYGRVGADGLRDGDGRSLAVDGEWVLLRYPMVRRETADGYESRMHARLVDEHTGQLTDHECVVFEQRGDEAVRRIAQFSLSPR